MSITNETSKIVYAMDGVTVTFPFPYAFYAATDLVVTKYTIADGTTAVLVLNTDYTVSGVAPYPSGANVVVTDDASSAYKLVIQRIEPLNQLTTYQVSGVFPAKTHEYGFDKLVLIAQQLQETISRAVLNNISSSTGFTLPDPVASNILGWNAAATALVNYTGYAQAVIDAAAYAAAAAASAATALSAANTASTYASAAAVSAAAASASALAAYNSEVAAAASAAAAAVSAAQVLGVTTGGAAVVDRFLVSIAPTITRGVAAAIIVYALSASGKIVTDYSATVTISEDGGGTLDKSSIGITYGYYVNSITYAHTSAPESLTITVTNGVQSGTAVVTTA